MDNLLVLLACLNLPSVLPAVRGEELVKSCSCGVYMEDQIGLDPIYSHKAFEARCSTEGDKECRSMCVALATLSKEKAPIILCSKLKGHVPPFKALLFWRNCNKKWTFSGLKGTDSISCHDGKPLCEGKCLTVGRVKPLGLSAP